MNNNRLCKRLVPLVLSVLAWSPAQAATYYYHNDHLGTPQVLTDKDQQVVWQAEYEPFGEATETLSIVEQNLRFPGQYFDRETGLHYNYFRDYDPSTGRYIQSDPRGILLNFSDPQRQITTQVGLPIPEYKYVNGLNHLYGYASQNPLMYTDPTGEALNPLYIAVGVALYTGYRYYTKIQLQIECEEDCAEKTKEQCNSGDTSGLTACKVKCVQDIWSTTFKKAPWVKRM